MLVLLQAWVVFWATVLLPGLRVMDALCDRRVDGRLDEDAPELLSSWLWDGDLTCVSTPETGVGLVDLNPWSPGWAGLLQGLRPRLATIQVYSFCYKRLP